MLKNNIKDELQNILSGKNPVGGGNVIQTIANYLRRSQATSKLAQTDKRYKKEETKKLLTIIVIFVYIYCYNQSKNYE